MAQTSRLREAREGRLEGRPVIAGPEAGDTGRKEKGPEAGRAGETLVGEAGRPGTVRRGLNVPEAGPLPCAPGAPAGEPRIVLAAPGGDARGAPERSAEAWAELTTMTGPRPAAAGGRVRAAGGVADGFDRADLEGADRPWAGPAGRGRSFTRPDDRRVFRARCLLCLRVFAMTGLAARSL